MMENVTAQMQRISHAGSPPSKRSQRRNKTNPGSTDATRFGQNEQYSSRWRRGGRPNGRELLQRLESQTKTRLAECTVSENDQALFERCTSELKATIKKLGPEWSMKLFGSSTNGFGTRSSDIDATLFEDCSLTDNALDAQPSATVLKERVVPLFEEHPNFSIVEEVLGANIPILKLCFEDRLDVDLSCRNVEALQNTRLLRGYADLGDRVRDLGILVKLWARAANVWGAYRRHLSSYTFTLLAIYFMQVHPDVQLPYLPTMAFSDTAKGDGRDKVAAARSLWNCNCSIAELVTRFFAFYHFDFQWGREVVSPRLGRRLWANDKVFEALRGRWTSRLHIEDPYKLERNLHCVLGPEFEESQLRVAFAEAWNSLQMGGIPSGLEAACPAVGGLVPEVDQVRELSIGRVVWPRVSGDDSADCTDEAGEHEESASGIVVRKNRTTSSFSSPDSSVSTACGRSRLGESSGGEVFSSDDEKKAAIARLAGVRSSPQEPDEDTDMETKDSKEKDLWGSRKLSQWGFEGWTSGAPDQWANCVAEDPEEEEEKEEDDAGKFQWWRHLGEMDQNGPVACPGLGNLLMPEKSKKQNKQPKAQWHNIQDLEHDLGGKAETVAIVKSMTGLSFVSRSTSCIAARVSKLCCVGNVAYQ